jgi:hypothetical protein
VVNLLIGMSVGVREGRSYLCGKMVNDFYSLESLPESSRIQQLSFYKGKLRMILQLQSQENIEIQPA